jgi:hypothetical protein
VINGVLIETAARRDPVRVVLGATMGAPIVSWFATGTNGTVPRVREFNMVTVEACICEVEAESVRRVEVRSDPATIVGPSLKASAVVTAFPPINVPPSVVVIAPTERTDPSVKDPPRVETPPVPTKRFPAIYVVEGPRTVRLDPAESELVTNAAPFTVRPWTGDDPFTVSVETAAV